MVLWRNILLVILGFILVSCSSKSSDPTSNQLTKTEVTDNYIKWFVNHHSDDDKLSDRLSQDFRAGWDRTQQLLSSGLSPKDVVSTLQSEGISAYLLSEGIQQTKVPGSTASFLVMDTQNGCHQIVQEKWTTTKSDGATHLLLAGMGHEDVTGDKQVEKQIHLAAFELPKKGEYVDIRTQSFSPLVKGVVVFTTVLLSTGCERQQEEPAPTPTPTPPPPPPACACSVTVNSSGNSQYAYPFLGGNAPLRWVSNRGTIVRSVEYVVNVTAGQCIPRQFKRDTYSYRDALNGNMVELRSPTPSTTSGSTDLGGHQSSRWSPDGPASSALQVNPNGSISWLDTPGVMGMTVNHLPVRKRAEYKVDVFDARTNALACSSTAWTLDVGIDPLRAWSPAPSDSLGGPYTVPVPNF